MRELELVHDPLTAICLTRRTGHLVSPSLNARKAALGFEVRSGPMDLPLAGFYPGTIGFGPAGATLFLEPSAHCDAMNGIAAVDVEALVDATSDAGHDAAAPDLAQGAPGPDARH